MAAIDLYQILYQQMMIWLFIVMNNKTHLFMNRTKIDWPNLNYTWNPIMGCANGCLYCYARKMNDRFKWIEDWSKPQFFTDRLSEPSRIKKPSTIFVGSMCDIFSVGVEWIWIEMVLNEIRKNPQHTFMLLTKNPTGYYNHEDYPENVWLGVTINGAGSDYKKVGRITKGPKIKDNGWSVWWEDKPKRFVSIEPLLGPIEFNDLGVDWSSIDLVIVGAMTGPGAIKPKQEWIESILHPNIHWKKNIKEYAGL